MQPDLHISHASKVVLKILQARIQQYMNRKLPMFKLDLEKAEEPEIKLPTSIGSSKKQEFQRNIYFCFIDYNKAFDCVDHNKLWKILKETGIQEYLTCLLRMCMQVKKQQLEWDMEQQTGSKLGMEYVKAVYCHPAYSTSMQSTSWEMPGWMKHKLESRLPGEISITSDTQMTPPLRQSEEVLKSLLMKVKENEKVGLKLNIQKTKIMASGPITSCK